MRYIAKPDETMFHELAQAIMKLYVRATNSQLNIDSDKLFAIIKSVE